MSPRRFNYQSSESGAAAYDAEYYRTGCGPKPYEHNEYWLNFFGSLADAIIAYLHPQTVFDAGCALGFLVESLRDRGVQAWGADISEFAISNVREDIRPYCRVASITKPMAGRYDLAACIEVLEHLTPDEARRAIANLTAITDTILFSSTPSDFNEPTHINVQPPIHWLELFAATGFSPDLGFNTSLVSPHAMLLRKTTQPLNRDLQVFYNDTILLSSAIALQTADVPAPAQVPPGHILSDAFTKSVEIMRIGDQLADFVQKNTEMGHLIDGISVVNQDMLKRNADLERRNEDLKRQVGRLMLSGSGAAPEQEVHAPPTPKELEQLRTLFDRDFYVDRYSDVREAVRGPRPDPGFDPFGHFMEHGWREGRLPHPLFDTAHYLIHHPELLQSGLNPVLHYLRAGILTRSNPHPLFDTAFYLNEYTDVVEFGLNPLIHFIEHGAREGRNPHPFFNTARYLAANPDVAASGSNALSHYVRSGAAEGRPLRTPVRQEDATPYATRIARIEPDAQELHLQRAVSRQFLQQPVISVVVPVYRVPLPVLKSMVESVRRQTYSRWELCLAHGDPEDRPARAWLRTMAQDDRRIKLALLEENLGISGNSNRALSLATGDYVGLLDHDDTLAPFALYEVAKVLNDKPGVDFIYSDKDCTQDQKGGDHGERISPLFKPQWSPDLMLSANYLTHFCVMRMEHMRAVGGWRPETDGAQDWDLFFRVIERIQDRGGRIEFIDKVLYHWGIVETSVASGGVQAKPYALRAQMRTISERLARIGGKGRPSLESNGAMRVRWDAPSHLISIVMVSDHPGDHLLAQAREFRKSIAHKVEIIVAAPTIDAGRAGDVLAVKTPPDAGLAEKLNAAAAASSGWGIIFLDDCVNVGHGDWIPELIGPLQLDGVGMVGPRLTDPETHEVRHAGIVFNRDGEASYVFAGLSEHAYGVFGGPSWCRDWSAISGGCFAIRRSVFDQAGGFHQQPRYPRFDIDLCLRVTVEHGWRIFYNSFADFRQGAITRIEHWLFNVGGPDSSMARDAARRYLPLGDPFFHPRLRCVDGKVLLDFAEDAPHPRLDYAAEARALTASFDFAPAEVACTDDKKRSSVPRRNRIAWFLPEFAHPFYGGVHTILRAADYFHQVHQVHSTFITPAPEVLIRSAITAAFPTLAKDCSVMEMTNSAQIDALPETDAAIATLWTTAYSVLHVKNARRKFYFMQDYESRFYPAGSISALVEATYHFGFDAICNTVSLRDIYTRLGGRAEYFDPSIDPAIFNAKTRIPHHRNEPWTLFCYARPSHARNSFELLSHALHILKKRLGSEVCIVTAGADWSPRQFGLEGVVHNLGLLPYSATGALYRSCTAGVALMMTCHPSYLPFELMASGALVVTNSNPYNSWLLKDRENCLLADSSASALAEALEEGLRNQALREQLVENAGRMIQERYSNWEAQMEKIYQYMMAVEPSV